MKYLIPLFSLLLICSCADDDIGIGVDLNQFDPITERYPYQNLQPQSPFDYLELIFSVEFEEEEVLFRSGEKCLNASNPNNCASKYDSFTNEVGGFGGGCLPSFCFQFVKFQQGDMIGILSNTNELKTFLGQIDSSSDAILLAVSQDYRFSTEKKEIGAIRKTEAGYELLVTKLVAFCAPIQTNRYLLEITTNGAINILQEEQYSSSDACI